MSDLKLDIERASLSLGGSTVSVDRLVVNTDSGAAGAVAAILAQLGGHPEKSASDKQLPATKRGGK